MPHTDTSFLKITFYGLIYGLSGQPILAVNGGAFGGRILVRENLLYYGAGKDHFFTHKIILGPFLQRGLRSRVQ